MTITKNKLVNYIKILCRMNNIKYYKSNLLGYKDYKHRIAIYNDDFHMSVHYFNSKGDIKVNNTVYKNEDSLQGIASEIIDFLKK